MVLTASGHIMLACRRRVWLPRVNSLILSSTIAFLVVKSHLAVTYIFLQVCTDSLNRDSANLTLSSLYMQTLVLWVDGRH